MMASKDYMKVLFDIRNDMELDAIVRRATEKLIPVPLGDSFNISEYQIYLTGYLLGSGYNLRKDLKRK